MLWSFAVTGALPDHEPASHHRVSFVAASVLAWTCAAESNNTMQERMCVCSFLCCRTPPLADCHKFIACTLQCLNEEKRMGIAPLLEDDTTFVVLQCGLKCRRGGEVTRWSSRERRGVVRWRKATRQWSHDIAASGMNKRMSSIGPAGLNDWTLFLACTVLDVY
jgi:hypothetical protein